MDEQNKVIDDFQDSDKLESNLNFWDYKNEQQIIGVFQEFQKDDYGEHPVLIIGSDQVHLPNLTALNSKLRRANAGDKVKIINLGEKKSPKSGRMYYDFDIYLKPTS